MSELKQETLAADHYERTELPLYNNNNNNNQQAETKTDETKKTELVTKHLNNTNQQFTHQIKSSYINQQQDQSDMGEDSDDMSSDMGDEGEVMMDGENWRIKKRKKWGQGTLQQCKHKNIFKNFGNIIIKYFKESEEFRTQITEIFGNFEKLAFMDWVFKEVKLESKKDFIKGWVELQDDDEQIAFFKLTLRRLSHAFLTKYGVDFLRKSRMKHKEIHLRCLQPLIECSQKPHNLKQFRPEDKNMEFEAMRLKNKW